MPFKFLNLQCFKVWYIFLQFGYHRMLFCKFTNIKNNSTSRILLVTKLNKWSLSNTRLFYKQPRAEIDKKTKRMLDNTLRLMLCYLKIIYILRPRYHPKIVGHILRNKQKNKYVCIHEIIGLIILKMKIKMKYITFIRPK